MKILYKIIIGGSICLGLMLAIFILDLPVEIKTALIITISIVVTFLGLAYYEEQQEQNKLNG